MPLEHKSKKVSKTLLDSLLLTFEDAKPNGNNHSKELKIIIDFTVAVEVALAVNFESPSLTGTGETSQSKRASVREGNPCGSSEGQSIQ